MYVAGTAGHVDHGKSTLIEALTGIDPDRLEQEKTRGMTIELGFAWMELDDNLDISIVDVPGHERFVKNMLMGAGGFDLALLVVAADEGVMPQTREHIAILDLLEVRHGIVVISKIDIADSDLVELVELEVADELAGTTLDGAPTIAVSAESGQNLDKLKQLMTERIRQLSQRPDLERPRLFIDRSFTVPGFGAVVTGTLDGGILKPGDQVEMLPSGTRARIRGLQSHKSDVEIAKPGARVAVSMTGTSHDAIQRGDALVKRGQYSLSAVFDAVLRSINNAPREVKHNHKVTVYSGTWEEPATVRLLSGDRIQSGAQGYVQIKLGGARPIVSGDRFVVRDSNDTLGGGAVLVVNPQRHRRNDQQLIARLKALAEGSIEDIVMQTLYANPLITSMELITIANMRQQATEDALSMLVSNGDILELSLGLSMPRYASRQSWDDVVSKTRQELSDYHQRYPLRRGMPRQELRNRLKLDGNVFDAVVTQLQTDGVIEGSETFIKLPGHQVVFSEAQRSEAQRYLTVLREHRFAPPAWNTIEPELLAALAARRDVVSAGPDVVFIADAYDEMRDKVIEFAKVNEQVSINDVREMLGTSRKYSLALLEQMDRENITMRNGDIRTLR